MSSVTEFESLPKEKPFETLIHDNGGRPFYIKVENGLLTISKNPYQNDYKWYENTENPQDYKLPPPLPYLYYYYDAVITTMEIEKYWSGFDNIKGYHGNSFLAKISGDKYLYAGMNIYTFTANDEIKHFAAGMGNNDVPYPVAYGTKNIYVLFDNAFIKIEDIPSIPQIMSCKSYFTKPWNCERVADLHYGNIKKAFTEKVVKCPSENLKNLEIVHKRIE